MWIMLNNTFLSIVKKDCQPDELLVRARRPGDIEKVFPKAKVLKLTKADYRYRTVVKTAEVIEALGSCVDKIDYPNFKNSVKDQYLKKAYNYVWMDMMDVQR